MGAILKYSSKVYETKIARMESLASQLQTHLTTLEAQKNQIQEFWDDDKGVKYYEIITDNIIKVKDAIEEINRLKQMYMKISGDLGNLGSLTDTSLSDTAGIVKTVIGIGGE